MAELTRLDALRLIDAAFPRDPLVLTLGTTVREMVHLTGVKDNHLYVLDSMGLPPAIGLGLALGLEESKFEKLVVVEVKTRSSDAFGTPLEAVGAKKRRALASAAAEYRALAQWRGPIRFAVVGVTVAPGGRLDAELVEGVL